MELSLALVGTQTVDITTDPDMTFSDSIGPDITMSSGGSLGPLDQNYPQQQQ